MLFIGKLLTEMFVCAQIEFLDIPDSPSNLEKDSRFFDYLINYTPYRLDPCDTGS